MHRRICLSAFSFYLLIACAALGAHAMRPRSLAPVPQELASSHFTVTIDGQPTPVMHAALHLYFLNFDASKHTAITVTADSDDFWAKGVEIQPWRLGIRPQRLGRTISFTLDGPAKISISRPGDYLAQAEMLFLFSNTPEKQPPTAAAAGLRYYGPGIHREDILAATGDSIYLAPGAVVFGSLDLWSVDHVKVFGRGVVVYDGPQNPADDDGWVHKRNWRCITMDNAHDISIEGITCVVRSRTWQIQMKDSRHILFDNVKVIGANAANANADGMDWLGGGDTVVRNSFFRAADDVFAMQTSWEGYGPKAFAVQGHPVTNITVENSVLSTSISNIVRAGWPEKNFEGGHFTMRNSDVLHMGLGGCGVPFALMELWADPAGRGQSADFAFENVRLEDWYSLVQLRLPARVGLPGRPAAGVRQVSFEDVMVLDLPSLVPSTLKGNVEAVSLDNVNLTGAPVKQDADLPFVVTDGAAKPTLHADGPQVHIASASGLVRPGQRIHLEAVNDAGDAGKFSYAWSFGDGTYATGRKVTHRFPDTGGTLWDGSGSFRALLHASSSTGRHTWISRSILVSNALLPAETSPVGSPGVLSTYRNLETQTQPQSVTAVTRNLDLSGIPHREHRYAVSFEGEIEAPADGSYTFVVIANDAGSLEIDHIAAPASPKPFPQVCGSAGNAARAVTLHVALAKGRHRLEVSDTHGEGDDNFHVLWQGPDFDLQPIAAERLSYQIGTAAGHAL